jgi:uncharacterized membrane protein
VEWNADMIGDIPNQMIAWASAEDADVENSGFVRFRSTARGKDVTVVGDLEGSEVPRLGDLGGNQRHSTSKIHTSIQQRPIA